MVGVGRKLEVIWCNTPWCQACTPRYTCLGSYPDSLWISPRRETPLVSGKSLSVLSHLHSGKCFLIFIENFCLSLCLCSCHCTPLKRAWSILFTPSPQICTHLWDLSWAFSSADITLPAFSAFLHRDFRPLPSLGHFAGLSPAAPSLSCTGDCRIRHRTPDLASVMLKEWLTLLNLLETFSSCSTGYL